MSVPYDEDGVIMMFLILAAGLYFLPAIVGFLRRHRYRWVILVLNICGFTGIFWVVAFAWAVFPRDRSFLDPVLGNATGRGERTAGDVAGEAVFAAQRAYASKQRAEPTLDVPVRIPEPSSDKAELLASIKKLREAGVLTPEDADRQTEKVLGR